MYLSGPLARAAHSLAPTLELMPRESGSLACGVPAIRRQTSGQFRLPFSGRLFGLSDAQFGIALAAAPTLRFSTINIFSLQKAPFTPNSQNPDGLTIRTGHHQRRVSAFIFIYFTIPAAFGESRKGVGYGEEAPTERCERKSSKEFSKVSR